MLTMCELNILWYNCLSDNHSVLITEIKHADVVIICANNTHNNVLDWIDLKDNKINLNIREDIIW